MGSRILVIDDNPANVVLMTYLLKACGHITMVARDGEEGVEMALHACPDLVLCDLALPKLDGLGVARRLKSEPSLLGLPLIAVTAAERCGVDGTMVAPEFDGYIGKPITPETFVAEVEGHLRKPAKQLLRKELEVTEARAARESAEARVAPVVRRESEQKVQAQLARLNLLHHITRAIGERQDLPSIFLVVIASVEANLPVDFGCICLYEPVSHTLTVESVGAQSQALAVELAFSAQARIEIDENGLSRCVAGELVYEPDIQDVPFPFPQRLARVGLRSFVAAPLLVENQVFGVLITARRAAHAFSSGECEFLRQLSEHVALASHHAQLYTALQQAYDDLRTTQQAVIQQERLRALGQMASGIAHDINNAMSPAALYAESLLEQETDLSPNGRKYLEIILRAIEDTAQTVDRMREFYREREPQLTLTPVDLNRLVPQVTELAHAHWSDMPQRQGIVIDLRLDLAADLPLIQAVESEIRQALLNLILNAVDAMPNGGTLTVSSRAVEASSNTTAIALQGACVEVTDTGVGMNDQTRSRCTEPFFTTKGERGTGLGLAMVYGVARRHSAELEIESAVGKGSTLRLSFPARPIDAVTSDDPGAPPTILSGRRLLVIDDDPSILTSLRDALEGDGHVVVTANGGQLGIDAFNAAQQEDERFDLVITDLGMPYINGSNVAATIKAASPSTPVILLTGWGKRLAADGDIPPNVDHVLGKPPKLRELRDAMVRCLRPEC